MSNDVSTVGAAIAKALVEAGLMPASSLARAGAIIEAKTPKLIRYDFTNDATFLHSSIEHHVTTYYQHVLNPTAATFQSSSPVSGRMLRDEEIQTTAILLTEQVTEELGREYVAHMERYFGVSGMAAFVYSRVHSRLMEMAVNHNYAFLSKVHKGAAVKSLAAATAGANARG